MATPDPPDPFSRFLPLPFRLELELILGFWLWALNLHGFARWDVDIFALIRYPLRPVTDDSGNSSGPGGSGGGGGGEPALHTSVYRLATALTAVWGVGIVGFWVRTRGEAGLVVENGWMANAVGAGMVGVMLVPRVGVVGRVFGSRNRGGLARLGQGLRRVAVGGIAKGRPEKFGDVLLADALTSYAKPVSEVVVVLCMFLRGLSTTALPDRRCGHELVVPLVIAWPFAVRLRQCLKEGQWANAAKYATAFPVIALSTMARGGGGLTAAWNLAAMVNSLYSFWWDVSKDWDLTLLSQSRHASPYGLRQQRVFVRPLFYYGVVVFDLVLRFAWSMKLSLHLVYLDGIEGGIFLMEILELCRRWVWVYFRVETEFVRSMSSASLEL